MASFLLAALDPGSDLGTKVRILIADSEMVPLQDLDDSDSPGSPCDCKPANIISSFDHTTERQSITVPVQSIPVQRY